jgi:hypothetical protein
MNYKRLLLIPGPGERRPTTYEFAGDVGNTLVILATCLGVLLVLVKYF